MAKHNLQALAIGLRLTNLQIIALHEIGQEIVDGKDGYLSYSDSLSRNEDKYLRYWLENEGMEFPKEKGGSND